MRKSFELDINGSCWEDLSDKVPEAAGIYFTYACYRNAEGKWLSGDLIYIGEAGDLRGRIKQHASAANPDDDLHAGLSSEYGRLWYTYALLSDSEADRRLCEAALIFKHKPLQNKEHKDRLGSHADIAITLRGETRKLVPTYILAADA